MRIVFEEKNSAGYVYPIKKQVSLKAPSGTLKGRSCKKIGRSYAPLKTGELFQRSAFLAAELALALLLVPLLFPSFRKSIKVLLREIRTAKEKVVHYVAFSRQQERKEPAEPPSPPKKLPELPIEPFKEPVKPEMPKDKGKQEEVLETAEEVALRTKAYELEKSSLKSLRLCSNGSLKMVRVARLRKKCICKISSPFI